MAGRYSGSYPERWDGWRAVTIQADIGQASLVGRIPFARISALAAGATAMFVWGQ